MNALALHDSIHDGAKVSCEELPFLDFSGARPADVAEQIDRLELRGRFAPVEADDNVVFLNGILESAAVDNAAICA